VTLGDLTATTLSGQLRGQGLRVRIGPFITRIASSLSDVHRSLHTLYAYHEVESGYDGAHFSLRVDPPPTLRRYVRRQVQLTFEGHEPFLPLPRSMAAPMLEAGLNWCVGNHAHQYLAIHAATLERHGRALLMPAPPGSGKSTLCAALVTRGWRLLSDEFALVDVTTGALLPIPRPLALKDQSIALLRAWAPDAYFGPEVDNNEGERVAYMRPAAGDVQATAPAVPGWIVIPTFAAGASVSVHPVSRARALLHLADNSFNYNLHGRQGFDLLTSIVDQAPCTALRYSDLTDGVRSVDRWTAETSAQVR
jgi:HprK-related kinase A